MLDTLKDRDGIDLTESVYHVGSRGARDEKDCGGQGRRTDASVWSDWITYATQCIVQGLV